MWSGPRTAAGVVLRRSRPSVPPAASYSPSPSGSSRATCEARDVRTTHPVGPRRSARDRRAAGRRLVRLRGRRSPVATTALEKNRRRRVSAAVCRPVEADPTLLAGAAVGKRGLRAKPDGTRRTSPRPDVFRGTTPHDRRTVLLRRRGRGRERFPGRRRRRALRGGRRRRRRRALHVSKTVEIRRKKNDPSKVPTGGEISDPRKSPDSHFWTVGSTEKNDHT